MLAREDRGANVDQNATAGEQRWDPERYRRWAPYVPELGRGVLDLLDPRPGERVLDLGCGDGELTEQLAARGCRVLGVDRSAEFVAAARQRGLSAQEADARHLAGPELAAGCSPRSPAPPWHRRRPPRSLVLPHGRRIPAPAGGARIRGHRDPAVRAAYSGAGHADRVDAHLRGVIPGPPGPAGAAAGRGRGVSRGCCGAARRRRCLDDRLRAAAFSRRPALTGQPRTRLMYSAAPACIQAPTPVSTKRTPWSM